jgi:hypothetical protein
VRRAAEWAAAAQQQLERATEEAPRREAADQLDQALAAMHQEVELLERNGVSVAGLVPRWLAEDYSRWRAERERSRPLWTVAYWPDDSGAGPGTITNRAGQQRDVDVSDGGERVRFRSEEDDRG